MNYPIIVWQLKNCFSVFETKKKIDYFNLIEYILMLPTLKKIYHKFNQQYNKNITVLLIYLLSFDIFSIKLNFR